MLQINHKQQLQGSLDQTSQTKQNVHETTLNSLVIDYNKTFDLFKDQMQTVMNNLELTYDTIDGPLRADYKRKLDEIEEFLQSLGMKILNKPQIQSKPERKMKDQRNQRPQKKNMSKEPHQETQKQRGPEVAGIDCY